jgi:hypothetical protein
MRLRCSCGPRRSAGPIPAWAAARRSRGSREWRSAGWRSRTAARKAITEVSEFGRTWRQSTLKRCRRCRRPPRRIRCGAPARPRNGRAAQSCNRGDPDRDGGVDVPKPEQDDDAERQQQRGWREQHIDQAHDDLIDPTRRPSRRSRRGWCRRRARRHGGEGPGQRVTAPCTMRAYRGRGPGIGAEEWSALGAFSCWPGTLNRVVAREQAGRDSPEHAIAITSQARTSARLDPP